MLQCGMHSPDVVTVLSMISVPCMPGGVLGMHAEACKNIQRHQLEGETFYIVDLGNVLRMYKVIPQRRVLGLSTALASPHHTTRRHPSVTPNPTKCLSIRASCNL